MYSTIEFQPYSFDYLEVINQTTSPSYIYGIAVSFIADIIGLGRLIVIDWHLGDNDWMAGCDDLHILDHNQLEKCKQRRIYRKIATPSNGLGSAFVDAINANQTCQSLFLLISSTLLIFSLLF